MLKSELNSAAKQKKQAMALASKHIEYGKLNTPYCTTLTEEQFASLMPADKLTYTWEQHDGYAYYTLQVS